MRAFLVLLGFSLLACTGTSTDEPQDTAACDGALHTDTMSLTSDADGQVTIPITLSDLDDAFMVLTEKASGTASTDGVVDPDGNTVLDWEDWASSRTSLTNAFYASPDVTVLNWPVRAEDGPLSPGDWTVYASTLDADGYPKAKQAVDVTVLRRQCVAGRPKVKVTIVYTNRLEKDAEVSSAVEQAADRWAEIYGAAGLDIDVDFASADADGSLPEPLPGDDEYTSFYSDVGEGVMVVIGDDVGGMDDLFGEAGGIPGPQIATPHSVVAVGWLIHAGADASFSKDEIELLAETMAHESGHFLGLYHPVESSFDMWDALGDTDKCTRSGDCDDALGTNMMYPYPICSGAKCTDQVDISGDQAGVLLNNVGVR